MNETLATGDSSVIDYTFSVCPVCGQAYFEQLGHTCAMGKGSASSAQWYPSGLTPIISIDSETKRLLERIATALKKLAGIHA